MNAGKLVKTIGEKCPLCHKPLQIRRRFETSIIEGVEVENNVDYVRCSNLSCDYEDEEKDKRKKKKHIRKLDVYEDVKI